MQPGTSNSTRTLALRLAAGVVVALIVWAVVAGVKAREAASEFRMMAKECHPIWRDFASQRFNPGDSLDALLAAHTPAWKRSLGDVTVCEFRAPRDPAVHPSPVRVTAVRGRLVSAIAGSCNWWHTFFDVTESSPTLCASAPLRKKGSN